MSNTAPTAADLAASVDTAITIYVAAPSEDKRQRITRAVRHIAEALTNATLETHRMNLEITRLTEQVRRLNFALAQKRNSKEARRNERQARRRGTQS